MIIEIRIVVAVLACVLSMGAASSGARADEAPASTKVDAAPRDWAAVLKADVAAMHRLLTENHPGARDPRNPGFSALAASARDEALARAAKTTSREGWWFALKGHAARFDDGHVAVSVLDADGGKAPPPPASWPGFLTRFEGADQIVADRAVDAGDAPPLKARLVSCDGVEAEALAKARVGAFEGLWALSSQRVGYGPTLFLDRGNPWTPRPVRCRFAHEGETRDHTLLWRPLDEDAAQTKLTALREDIRPPFEMRALDGGVYRLSMASFNGREESAPFKGLTRIVKEARAAQDALRAAPFIVLDVRGNGGGSSHWSEEIAEILWGADWIAAHPKPGDDTVDWRASPDNTAAVAGYAERFKTTGQAPKVAAELAGIVEGMAAALKAGRPFWREADETATRPDHTASDPVSPLSGPVYLLTNYRCASSCLTAVDLWKALGAVQVGRETLADTFYLEVRHEALPSGAARGSTPMKVYRNRARGSDAPQEPDYVFPGDMTDDDALTAWMRTLPPSR